MNKHTERCWLNFSPKAIDQPIMCDLARAIPAPFSFKIGQATMSTELGIMSVELVGNKEMIKQAIKFLKDRGVYPTPIEHDVVT